MSAAGVSQEGPHPPDLARFLPLPALPFPLGLGNGCVSGSGFGRLLGFEVELSSICSRPGNRWPNTACSSVMFNEMAGEASLEDYQAGRCVFTRFFDLLVTEQASSLFNANEFLALWVYFYSFNLYFRMLAPDVLLERGRIGHELLADDTVLS